MSENALIVLSHLVDSLEGPELWVKCRRGLEGSGPLCTVAFFGTCSPTCDLGFRGHRGRATRDCSDRNPFHRGLSAGRNVVEGAELSAGRAESWGLEKSGVPVAGDCVEVGAGAGGQGRALVLGLLFRRAQTAALVHTAW